MPAPASTSSPDPASPNGVELTPAPAVQSPGRLRTTFRALNHRNFQLFFGGQLISLTGTWMQTIAQSWLVYRMTGSSLLLGTVGFFSQFPVFVLAPLGGMLADRVDRRRVVIGTQTASMILAFLLAALTLSHKIEVTHIFVLSGLLGVVNAFDIPARQSFLSDMVGREDLMNAIALNSSMFNGARMIGPAVAGIVVARIGEGWCFFSNAVSYIAVIIGLLLMKVHCPRRSAEISPLESLIEGFRFVSGTVPIRALLLLLGLVSLVCMPYTVLMPIFAAKILHGGPKALGTLMGASGVGAMFGALTLASRSGVRGLGRWVAIAAGALGFFLIAFAMSQTLWLSTALLVPVGYCMMLEMSSSNTLIQSMTPDALRGRVMAVYSMMFMGMAPFGAFFGGALAERLGAQGTVAIGGMASILGALVFARFLPLMRDEARRLIVAQESVIGETGD
jgi:MFS family permease